MPAFPIVFRFRDIIAGRGFFAGVDSYGRATLVEEDGEFWVYGVNPGALAASGVDRTTAFAEFKRGYLSVLHDVANEAGSFEAFERDVSEFFNVIDDEEAAGWSAARQKVIAGELHTNLEKVEAGEACIQIHKLQAQPSENRLEPDEIRQAA